MFGSESKLILDGLNQHALVLLQQVYKSLLKAMPPLRVNAKGFQ